MTPLPLRLAIRLLPADARDEVLVELLDRFDRIAAEQGPGAARRWACREPWAAAVARVRWGTEPGGGRTSMTIDLVSDLLVAARGIRRRAGVAAAVIGTVAISVGALAAISGVIDAVLLRPLPYPDSNRMVWLQIWDSRSPTRRLSPAVNPQDALDWRSRATSFEAMTAIETSDATVLTPGGAVRASVARLNVGAERVLGVAPAQGRFFTEADAVPGVHVTVLTDAFWRTKLGADPSSVGRSIVIDGDPFTVVGVLPRLSLSFPDPDTDLWVPLVVPARRDVGFRSGTWERVAARLAPSASLASAQAEMSAIAAALAAEFPKTNGTRRVAVVPFRDLLVGDARSVLWLIAGALAMVQVVASANVGHLLLVTAQARRREFAIRSALGASGGRLLRLTLVESTILSMAGGVAGMILAPWILRVVIRLYPGGLPPIGVVRIGGVAVLVAAAATAFAAMTSALPPLLLTRRIDLRSAMHGGTRATASQGQRRVRTVLVLAQVAVSTSLLIGGGLLLRSFWELRGARLGFAADHLLTFNIALSRPRYPDLASEGRFYQDLSARLRAIPGVTAVGSSSLLPLVPGDFRDAFTREGYHDVFPDLPRALLQNVTPGLFEALGLRRLEGRTIENADGAASPPVAVVNETFERQYFPDGAVGRHIRFRGRQVEIVGVVSDKTQHGPREDVTPDLYLPRTQSENPRFFGWVLVRTTLDPSSVAGSVTRAVHDTDPTLSIADMTTMAERVDAMIAPDRFRAVLIGALSVVALVLAVIGLYGLIAYSVALRARDIAIRMALGADATRTAGAVVREMLLLAMAGMVVGLGIAAAGARLLHAFLLGVSDRDPVTFAAVPLVLTTVALLAAVSPALRAARVDPLTVLRSD